MLISYRIKEREGDEAMGRKRIGILLLFFLFLLTVHGISGAQGGELKISVPGTIAGYQSNPINVESPEAGILTIEIRDENTLYRRLINDIPRGKSQIIWDGLGWNEERLARKDFRLFATMTGESGLTYNAEVTANVGQPIQAILFALPSDGTVYLEEPAEWFLEFKMLYTDHLTLQFFRGEKMVLEVSRQAKGGRVNQLTWKALMGNKKLETGKYRVRASGQQHPSNAKEFMVRVEEGHRPVLPIEVTGDIMPDRENTDEEIWAKMMAPATIINIPNVSHQRVYREPDIKSRVLGTLHGQSQSLSVMEIAENWVRIRAWNHEKGALVEGWVPKKNLKAVRPQEQYGLLIDKKKQTLTLFEAGKRVDTLLVSTGRMKKGELYQETAAGSFLTDEHMTDYSTNGLKYDFVIRYDGGNLLHQIPYSWSESGKKDMIPGEVYLGTKASHACIRIQEKPSETGINAYWFWTHLPYHTRVIVLDDPEEREKLETIVSGNTPDIEKGLADAWRVEPEAGETDSITITFGGDAVLGGRESYYGLAEGFPSTIEKHGLEWPFEKLRSVFANDDLTSVNLECVLKDDAAGEDLEKAWRFRGKTEYAGILKAGSIELVNIANNHTIDYGKAGYDSTIQALAGIAEACGNGLNQILEIRGHLFGFGGCRETSYCENPGIIAADIQELKQKGAEFIIYQCHWGTEYDANHNALQEAMARACQRAGADLVIGHHPHVVQGIDWIEGMPVVYSLGNLVFGGTIRLSTYDGILVQAVFNPSSQTERIQLKVIPIMTSGAARQKANDYQACIATGDDALRILKKVQQDTGFLLTDSVNVAY